MRAASKPRMAVVRGYRPNLAEMALYRPFTDHFDLSFYFAGLPLTTARCQLNDLGLGNLRAVRYRSYADFVSWEPVRRVIDSKVGLGACLLSKLDEIASHEYVNIVDPIYAFTYQVARRLRAEQKLVLVRWENIYGRFDRVWLASRYAPRVLSRADLIICVSKAALSTLAAPPEFSGRIVHIYPGIDLRKIEEYPQMGTTAPRSDPLQVPTLLFVGRLQWTKGLSILLPAFKILLTQFGQNARLRIVGGGDLKGYTKLAEKLGISNCVEFLGFTSLQTVRTLMCEAYAFCFPSLASPNWAEQYGFALVEAMAHGLPVVAFDTGVIREICGDHATYASAGNAYSLAEAMATILVQRNEAELHGQRLRERAFREFDADKQGRKMEEAILEITRGRDDDSFNSCCNSAGVGGFGAARSSLVHSH